MAEVEVYTQPWCPYCARALSILHNAGFAFREIEAPQGTPERAESMRRAGGLTSVPQIFIDGEHIGGCDELVDLQANGRLDALRKPV